MRNFDDFYKTLKDLGKFIIFVGDLYSIEFVDYKASIESLDFSGFYHIEYTELKNIDKFYILDFTETKSYVLDVKLTLGNHYEFNYIDSKKDEISIFSIRDLVKMKNKKAIYELDDETF